MPNILITGTASGLGPSFLQQYLLQQDPNSTNPTTFYAIDNATNPVDYTTLSSPLPSKPITVDDFRSWSAQHIKPISLDITSPSAIYALFQGGILQNVPLHLIIHCAGIRGLLNNGANVTSYADVKTSESLSTMDAETMQHTFNVNVIGTFSLLQACVPGLRLAESQSGLKPKVILMGSRMGSISSNTPTTPLSSTTAGGAYAYRASKAALNAVVRSLSIDVPQAIWTVVHPGRVETGLVRVREDGAMTAGESTGEMMRLIERLEEKDSGCFVDRFGVGIGW